MSAERTSPLELDQATMQRLGYRITDLVAEHLATLRQQPAQRSLARDEAQRLIAGPAPETGLGFEELLAQLRERVLPYHAREPHPHFMGYIPSSPTFPAVLGDWVATGFNFFAGVRSVAAGPNEVETTVLSWFREWIGMAPDTGGLLTSGGSAATLTAIVAARHAALHRQRGVEDAALLPRLTLYGSDQAHSSVARAAWTAGIPRANVRTVASDDGFRMRVDALRSAIAADREAGLAPFLVAASAGTTNTGAIDPLSEIADVCEREALWLHVDAAFGGFVALLPGGRAQLAGIERADSVTLDPHKWLFVPFECGCLLVRNPRALEAAFTVHPEYMSDVHAREQEANFSDLGPQLSRYSRALKVWFSVTYFGLAPIREAIACGVRRAQYAETIVRSRPDFEVLSPAQLGILCFRVHPDGVDAGAELDALNDRINERVNAGGQFLMSSTRLRGAFSLRVCTHVHRMTEGDIDAVIAAVSDAYAHEGPMATTR